HFTGAKWRGFPAGKGTYCPERGFPAWEQPKACSPLETLQPLVPAPVPAAPHCTSTGPGLLPPSGHAPLLHTHRDTKVPVEGELWTPPLLPGFYSWMLQFSML
uniref:Uncharacterized protein n=1 Tax=Amazona collaria TaxID=241587 RepID=A0A8B9GE12_9PSIT